MLGICTASSSGSSWKRLEFLDFPGKIGNFFCSFSWERSGINQLSWIIIVEKVGNALTVMGELNFHSGRGRELQDFRGNSWERVNYHGKSWELISYCG